MAELLTQAPAVFIAVVFAFALLIGSFLNVVIYRLPLMMMKDWREQCDTLLAEPAPKTPEGTFNLVVPRSQCPSCGKMITAWQNVPVFSYLLLGGQCANCKRKISTRYPLIELFTALLAAACAWRFGFGWEALAAIGLSCALVAISVIDIDHQLIPDSIVLPLMWAGLILSLWHPLPGAETLFVAPEDALIGAIAGYLSLWSVYQLFKLATGKEGMGYGDFKLLAALGAWLGWQQLPAIILLSAAVGSVIGIGMIVLRGRDRSIPIPFGPYLAGAGWIAMLYGDAIARAYWDAFV